MLRWQLPPRRFLPGGPGSVAWDVWPKVPGPPALTTGPQTAGPQARPPELCRMTML